MYILEGLEQHEIDIKRPFEVRYVTNEEESFQNFNVSLQIFLTDLHTIS